MKPRSLRLYSQTRRASALDGATRQDMWQLFRRYYDGVSQETFERDLSRKRHVIVLRDSGDGSVQGFSTLTVFDERVGGRRVVVVFSGDTVVEEAYWGQSALQRAFFRYIMRTKLRHPLLPVYWFLISKGYRTYLLLSRNFPEYWPRHDRPTPSWQLEVLDGLARRLYPAAWRPELGVLQFESCQGRLRDGVAQIERHMLEAPDIRYFAQRNPGHTRGDELCCLGRIDLELAVSYAMKLLRRALGLRRAPPRSLEAARPRPSLP